MAIYHEHMSDEEKKIAGHFEYGLTDEAIEKVTALIKPELIQDLPPDTARLVHERAVSEGVSEQDILRQALGDFLNNRFRFGDGILRLLETMRTIEKDIAPEQESSRVDQVLNMLEKPDVDS